MKNNKGFTTTTLHSDLQKPIEHGSLHKPVHTSVAYGYENAEDIALVFQGKQAGFSYGRANNPTTAALAEKITKMEGGVATACFATGMSAISTTMLSLLKAGDHFISSSFLFGNTNSFFNTLTRFGVEVSFVDSTNADNIRAALQPNTKAVFVETIANPATQVTDLMGIGEVCVQHNILYIVDNTLTSGYLFQPKIAQASLVINSLTKVMGGHGVSLGGSVTETGLYDWSRYDNLYDIYKKGAKETWGITQILKKGLRDMGGTLPPESAHHLAVGMETTALRLERSCANALALARFFEAHDRVNKVFYPGIESHNEYRRARDLFTHYGFLMSIELHEDINRFDFLNALSLVVTASNLGDNRTLAIPIADTIYYEMGAERRASMGIADGMIRFSVGIEDIDDLVADFLTALAV